MVWPYTWIDQYRVGMKSGAQCQPEVMIPDVQYAATCKWFNNYTFVDHPTLDESLRTYQNEYYVDWTSKHPWRSPGAAYIHSPCGVAGGNPYGCPEGSSGKPGHNCQGGGFAYGPFAENFDFSNVAVTEWKRNSTVEAAWGIIANHGGGYSYRLCKVPSGGVAQITEECFQQTPLKATGNQWVQYGNEVSTRKEFPAHRTTEGTTPKGSQWTRNPIPACKEASGGYLNKDTSCPQGTQFEPPLPGLMGFGELSKAPGTPTFLFSIGDYLEVPDNLETGDYVLSFRWDCEQTPQVWATCSSIKIVE